MYVTLAARSVTVEDLALRACTLRSPGRHSRPLSFVISHHSGSPLYLFVFLRGSSCPSCFSKNIPPPPTTPPVAPQGRSVLRSLFSGHASAPWSFVLFVTAPQGKPSTGSPPPHPSPRRGAPFSVLCSLFSGVARQRRPIFYGILTESPFPRERITSWNC